MTFFPPSLSVSPSSPLADAFGRLRVSNPFATLGAKQVSDNAPFLMETQLTGSATAPWSQANSSTIMTCTTASGDKVVRQSRIYAPYQEGRSMLVLMTGVIGAAKSNVRQRMGIFDDADGVFFQQSGPGTLAVVLRSSTSGSPVNTVVAQADWNMDKLDGSGPSGITLDLSKSIIVVVDYEWLGMGRVRIGIVSPDGQIVYCHAFKNANTGTTVFMQQPSLPVRWELENTGATASGTTMTQTCASVFSEAGFDPRGYVISADVGLTGRNLAAATPLPLISVRLKSAYKRGIIIPVSFDFMSTTANSMRVQVVVGGTLTGASFNPTTGSASEFDIAASAITGGVVVATAYSNSTTNRASSGLVNSAIVAAANMAGVTDIVTLVVTSLTRAAITNFGSLTWKEIY